MAPPPIPIDPAIDNWRPSSIILSPGLGLDNLLQTSPTVPDRLTFSGRGSLDSLSQDLQLPAMQQNPTEPNPLLRFWNDPGPWTSQRVAGAPGHTSTNTQYASFNDQMTRNGHLMQYDYRSPRSEVGSSTTGRYPYDSGYGGSSRVASKSVRSADQVDKSQSCHNISRDVHNLHIYPKDGYQDPPAPNEARSSSPYPSTGNCNDAAQQPGVTFDLACQYPNCGAIFKNQSEHR